VCIDLAALRFSHLAFCAAWLFVSLFEPQESWAEAETVLNIEQGALSAWAVPASLSPSQGRELRLEAALDPALQRWACDLLWRRIQALLMLKIIPSSTEEDSLRALIRCASACTDLASRLDERSLPLFAAGCGGVAAVEPSALTPRDRRVAFDAAFELAAACKRRAEQAFPADAIRAHLHLHLHRARVVSSGSKGGGAVSATTAGAGQSLDALALWLGDLHLGSTVDIFNGLGFRELRDLQGLSLSDCREYFSFLRPGDLLRLSKHAALLGEEAIQVFERRAAAGLKTLPLLPPPTMS
jgi:hypothetical protein